VSCKLRYNGTAVFSDTTFLTERTITYTNSLQFQQMDSGVAVLVDGVISRVYTAVRNNTTSIVSIVDDTSQHLLITNKAEWSPNPVLISSTTKFQRYT
jgi:hypothetical protein